VVITSDFTPYLVKANVSPRRISVIENWAPLADMPIFPKDNDWAQSNGFIGRRNIVYAGTLGLKHNPGALLKLAREVDATITIFSQGPVIEALETSAQLEKLTNLQVKSWVAFSDLPKMLAAADIVCALIEPDAGIFSVPSKVLSYMAAGRPILAAIPAENLAARLIKREGAGLVVEPGNEHNFVEAAKLLLSSPEKRQEMSFNGRKFAEVAFDIEQIASRFEASFRQAQHLKATTGDASRLLLEQGELR
jgi:glycosyltransferase involved in cell wall biosynthesis